MDSSEGSPAAKRARKDSNTPAVAAVEEGTWKPGGTKWAKHNISLTGLAFTPKQPPMAPEEKGKRLLTREYELMRMGDTPRARDFNSKDILLWAPMPAELFRARSRVYDRSSASVYMRWWFSEHEDMPVKPPGGPRSAFAMFVVDQKREIFKKTGKWNQKKDSKKVGAAWTAAPGEIRAMYSERFTQACAQAEERHEAYNAALTEWRHKRQERLAASGEGFSTTEERRKKGLNPICSCQYCTVELDS